MMRSAAVLLTLTLVAAGCGSDDEPSADTSSDTQAPVETDAASDTEAPTETAPATEVPATEAAPQPVTGPATITASDQRGDGATVTVDSVDLPTDGFVVIHADADGGPGEILGWSDLLPAGESTAVVVTLDTPVTESATLFPMAHVDANGNGEYEFMPPDVTIDVPALTSDGDVAVLPIGYEIAAGESTGEEAGSAGTSIQLASTDLGEFVVDGEGNTLYLFVPDAAGDSTCYDECEVAWPIMGEVTDVGDGLDPALLGSITRTTGDVQATYNGWPLYYFASDAAPGDVNGQGVGDVWYVIDAAGEGIAA
jgi:predicted lipoprotein with Yx(FWY)xxD motif